MYILMLKKIYQTLVKFNLCAEFYVMVNTEVTEKSDPKSRLHHRIRMICGNGGKYASNVA